MNARRQEDSVTPSCSAPGPWSGSTGEMILPGPKFVFTFGVNHFHVLSWSGNNTRELCCIWRSGCLYSQPNCSLYCTLTARSTTVTCFTFLPHSFTYCTYARSLSLARPHTPHYTALTTTDRPTLAASDLTSQDLMVMQ